MLNAQLEIRKLLHKHYTLQSRKNPAYSVRAFAKRIGVHSGAVSEIFSGKRKISRRLAERIVTRLGLDPQERSEVLGQFGPAPTVSKKQTDEYLKLSAAQFRAIADWEHLAILSLVSTVGFSSQVPFVASRLGITEARASAAIERLLKLGMLRLDTDGKITRTEQPFRTTDDVPSEALRTYYEQTLDLAKNAIHEVPVELRDLTSMILKMNPKTLSMAKELIRKFQDEFGDQVEQESTPTEVYLLSMQMIPLTQVSLKE